MGEAIYYVYEYYRNDKVYYVGKGSKSRYREGHTYVDVPGLDNIKFPGENMSEDDAYDLEESLTYKYGLKIDNTGVLENKAHGGKSSYVPSFTGHNHTEEAKQKISEGNKGKVRTEAHKENYSKPKTKEHAENIRQANLGRKDSEERREANRRGANRPDVVKRKSDAMKALWKKRKELGLGRKGKIVNKVEVQF